MRYINFPTELSWLTYLCKIKSNNIGVTGKTLSLLSIVGMTMAIRKIKFMISGDPTIITMSNTMLVKASEIMGINHSPLYLIWEDFWAS